MSKLYLISVYLHVLSAIVWIGGIAFIVTIVVPWLRRSGKGLAGPFLAQTGRRFRNISYVCFAVLALTGVFNLWVRGVRLSAWTDPVVLNRPWDRVVLAKLATFALVLFLSVIHDFWAGPRAVRLILSDPDSAAASRARKLASWFGRANALLALLLVALAVLIVRGVPS